MRWLIVLANLFDPVPGIFCKLSISRIIRTITGGVGDEASVGDVVSRFLLF